MSEELWSSLDAFYADRLAANDPVLDRVLERSREAGLRNIAVSKAQGKMLMLLVMATRARRVLEIGTLGGYSALWMARWLPEDGRVITLEKEPDIAALARQNIDEAGASGKVEVRVGEALETLRSMTQDGAEPFDLIFIDADRENLPAYLGMALKLGHPGTMLIADNMVRRGYVADSTRTGADLEGIRGFLDEAGKHPNLECTVVQTVGEKGHDGFAMCAVR